MKIIVAERIRELMKENSITQLQLANAIHRSQGNISEWLSGKKEPSILSLWLLADYFEVSIDYLVGRVNL